MLVSLKVVPVPVVVPICAKFVQPEPVAALHPVAGDPDVVGRRAPGQVDLTGTDHVRAQRPGCVGGVVSGVGVVALAVLEYVLRLPAASVARTR